MKTLMLISIVQMRSQHFMEPQVRVIKFHFRNNITSKSFFPVDCQFWSEQPTFCHILLMVRKCQLSDQFLTNNLNKLTLFSLTLQTVSTYSSNTPYTESGLAEQGFAFQCGGSCLLRSFLGKETHLRPAAIGDKLGVGYVNSNFFEATENTFTLGIPKRQVVDLIGYRE